MTLFLRNEKARRRDLTGEDEGEIEGEPSDKPDDALPSDVVLLLVEEDRRLVSSMTSWRDTLAAGRDGAAASSRTSVNFDDVIVDREM